MNRFNGNYIVDSPESKVHNLGDLKPFQIVSLFDMLFQFKAGELADFIGYLFYFSETLKAQILEHGQEAMLNDHPDISRAVRERLDLELPLIAELGLKRTVERIDDLVIVSPRTPSALTLHLLLDRYGHIWNALRKDLRHYTFLWMPTDSVAYYEQEELFGSNVANNFPEANKEIMLAGNCYATGNYTASVFHLTRVLESGLKVLADNMGTVFTDINAENWEGIISKVEGDIQAKIRSLPKGSTKAAELEFFSGAAKQFRYFKEHWRNPVDHFRGSYDEPQALSAINHVRDFMRHVATKLKE